jgi:potassium-transporting ATPase potassium-binding subunit
MAFALVRGFARAESSTVGNFWADLTRSTLYILLPLSIVFSLVLVALGVPQTLAGSVEAATLEGAKQLISIGPVASQEAIKELGTNGGGFFNANSAHPFENPNAISNMLENWALLVIPFATVFAFGRAVADFRQGRALAITMGIVLAIDVLAAYWAEAAGNPLLTAIGVDPSPGNMEGKEVRFGIASSTLFAVATTGTSTGAVNSMHDSFMPLGGLIALFNMLMGSIAPGGVGAGLYGFLVLAVIAVFVAGLLVDRMPEYLGKKIESREMKLAMLAVLIYPLNVLGFSAVSVMLQTGLDSLNNDGPHGLSEILYAFASTNDNNGSAFAGLSGNTLCITPRSPCSLAVSLT